MIIIVNETRSATEYAGSRALAASRRKWSKCSRSGGKAKLGTPRCYSDENSVNELVSRMLQFRRCTMRNGKSYDYYLARYVRPRATASRRTRCRAINEIRHYGDEQAMVMKTRTRERVDC